MSNPECNDKWKATLGSMGSRLLLTHLVLSIGLAADLNYKGVS